MRALMICWSFLERLHTLDFAARISGVAELDTQTLLLLACLGVGLMTYLKLDRRDGENKKRRRRSR
jgi:hypothetical protein